MRTRLLRGLAPIAAALLGCTAPAQLDARGTARAPSAKAEIDVELEGPHRDVDVQISDLPEPASLGTGHERYGVWLLSRDADPRFLGFLRYQDDIEYGELETQAPPEPVEIIVTGENDPPGAAPSDAVVLRRAIP